MELFAQTPPRFQSATIKPCKAFRKSTLQEDLTAGILRSNCTSVERLLQQAYGLFANGHMNPLSSLTVSGGPEWIRNEFYEVVGYAPNSQNRATMNGPMLQALLEERFRLRVRKESREVPVYTLTLAKEGPALTAFRGSCIPWDFDHPPPVRSAKECGTSRMTASGMEIKAATIDDLRMFFLVTLDRPVVDATKAEGRFDFNLALAAHHMGRRARTLPALSDPSPVVKDSVLIAAIQTAVAKAGLSLKPSQGRADVLVVDRIERPALN